MSLKRQCASTLEYQKPLTVKAAASAVNSPYRNNYPGADSDRHHGQLAVSSQVHDKIVCENLLSCLSEMNRRDLHTLRTVTADVQGGSRYISPSDHV